MYIKVLNIKSFYSFTGKFLASFVLVKKPLREITMLLIEKVFSLYLQTQVNYSGAGGKHPLKSLCSTQVLISKQFFHVDSYSR